MQLRVWRKFLVITIVEFSEPLLWQSFACASAGPLPYFHHDYADLYLFSALQQIASM